VIIPDVNVLLYAFDEALPHHEAYAAWLTDLVTGQTPFGLSELVAFGFLRIATNPRIMERPATTGQALDFLAEIQGRPNCRMLRPGPQHVTLFTDLCRHLELRGNLVSDAHHAALAIEHGGIWATSDADFERFPDLLWLHPLHQALGRNAQPTPDFAQLAATIAAFQADPSRFSGGDRVILQSRCREAVRRLPRMRLLTDPSAQIDPAQWETVAAFARGGG
jgi:toxin-antitoxin system PIN domain toxin